MDIRLLGNVEVFDAGVRVDLGGQRPARLLVALITADQRQLRLNQLVDRCFDEVDRPEDPVPAIRTAVRRVRRALGDEALVTRSGGYVLEASGIAIDLDAFEQAVASARAATDPVHATTAYRSALDLWRGDPFGRFGDLEWLVGERVRLEQLHLSALEGWHEAHLRNGTATVVIPSLEAAAAEHPLRERFHHQLMHGLFQADRQADALRAFQNHRSAMIDAGLELGADIVALEKRISARDEGLKSDGQGRSLRGYRIVERLGEGAFSIVYRGTQPSVDRGVAIKQIRAELANRPEFIQRFEAEAHMVARLEHPYIVPLYDFWREPGSAYLVMRLLPGGSLESSLLEGSWGLERTKRMVDQIGSALSTAHRAGIVHRDVKPANILLDAEGNAYLTDFGIALEASAHLDPESALSAGSPAYASPEQLRREPVGPSADIHGLGIAAYEALTGRLPFPDEPNQAALLQRQLQDPIPPVRASRSDVPVAVDEVLQKATAKRAEDRYQTIEEFLASFDAASAGGANAGMSRPLGGATVVAAGERNPFKGLRAFDEADAGDFRGRDRLVDQLLSNLTDHRFLALVGPSGSGKSSAVRAGLLPALRRGAVPGSDDWFIATITPGARPFEELEAALVRVATELPVALMDVLTDGERGIARALRRVLPEQGSMLLVIDQFEEIFTLCDDEAERRSFLDGLASAIADERSPLHVVITLRADFYDRPLRYESIGRLVRDATVPLLPLAADELERAIMDPALAVGCEFEPGLVSEIVADVSDQPGSLPLLQYALTELYDRRVSGLLTRDAYRDLGGVVGALAIRAEELFIGASPDDKEEIRRLFGRLVTLGEGVEDTRRRVERTELGGSGATDRVIDQFGSARLLSFDRDRSSREPTVEVAHEALLREWPRLRSWLDEDRDGLRLRRHLTAASGAWALSGHDLGELYRGGRLEAAEAWVEGHSDDLNDAELDFLAASSTQRQAEAALEVEAFEAERRANRRLRALLGAVAVVAAFAVVAGAVAFQQRSRAEDSADEARAQAELAGTREGEALGAQVVAEQTAYEAETARLIATSASLTEDNPRVAMLLAAAAHQREETPASLGALQRALAQTNGLLAQLRDERLYRSVEWVSGNRVVAVHEEAIELIDLASGDTIESLTGDFSFVDSRWGPSSLIGTNGDGSMVAVATGTPSVAVYSIGDGISLEFEVRIDDPIRSVTMADDGRVVVADKANAVTAISADGLVLFTTDLDDSAGWFEQIDQYLSVPADVALFFETFDVVTYAGLSGTDIVAVAGSLLHRFDWDGQRLAEPVFLVEKVSDLLFPGNARHYLDLEAPGQPTETLSVSINSTGRLADADPPSLLQLSPLEGAGIGNGLAHSVAAELYDGVIVAGMSDGSLVRFDAETSGRLDVIDLDLGPVVDLTLSPDGASAVVAHRFGLTHVALGGGSPISTSVPRTPGTSTLSIMSDGSVIVMGPDGNPGPYSIVRLSEGVYEPLPANESDVFFALAPPLGPGDDQVEIWRFVDRAISPDRRVVRLDADLEEFAVLPAPSGGPAGSFGLEIDRQVSGDGTPALISINDFLTGEFITSIVIDDLGTSTPTAAMYDPSNRRILVANQAGQARLLNGQTLEYLPHPIVDTADIVVAFWNDSGSLVATASSTGVLSVRDGETFEIVQTMLGSSGASSAWAAGGLVFSLDDTMLLTNVDDAGQLWDVEAGEAIGGQFPTAAGTNSGANFGEELQLVTATDESVLVWNLDTDAWPGIACRAAGSDLTQAEWDQWGPRDKDHHSICSDG